jgi:pimeloyl-ACP methyl ester carboxylesterase
VNDKAEGPGLKTTTLRIADIELELFEASDGAPLLWLHDGQGFDPKAEFVERFAVHRRLILPSHPGFGKSSLPDWLDSVDDIAHLYLELLDRLDLEAVDIVGCSIGGWIAAEMATMAPRSLRALVLVGAMGIKPDEGDILDQALVNYIEYARAGFHDPRAFERVYGAEPTTDQLEAWDLNREMSFRIAWKPYMYSPTLPHLLGGVTAPALVVWGANDRIVPLSCGERYARSLPNARLEIVEGAGHCVAMERPAELTQLIERFLTA